MQSFIIGTASSAFVCFSCDRAFSAGTRKTIVDSKELCLGCMRAARTTDSIVTIHTTVTKRRAKAARWIPVYFVAEDLVAVRPRTGQRCHTCHTNVERHGRVNLHDGWRVECASCASRIIPIVEGEVGNIDDRVENRIDLLTTKDWNETILDEAEAARLLDLQIGHTPSHRHAVESWTMPTGERVDFRDEEATSVWAESL